MASDKAAKKTAAEAAPAAEPTPKPVAAPRPPADPRLKFVKKLTGRYLPRGPLRDRQTDLLKRWNSGEEHGGVTFEELKTLHVEWKVSREKPAAKA